MTKNRRLTPFVAFVMAIIMLLGATVPAHAASIIDKEVFSARTSYHPSSGMDSGYFTGSTSSSARFDNLPFGTLTIAYSIDGSGTYRLRFYPGTSDSGGFYQSGIMQGDGTTTVYLPSSGTYTVVLYSNSGSGTTYYGYNLYT